MTTMLVSAAARRTLPVTTAGPRVALAARAAAQHDGHGSVTLDRIATPGDTVPSASAFQSAL